MCSLKVKDYAERRGIKMLRVYGKGGKLRYFPVHPNAVALLEEYLDVAGHRLDMRTGTSPDYARKRVKDHLLRFIALHEQLTTTRID